MAERKKIHRFICAFSESGGRVTVSDRDAVHQMRRVLKLTPGEEVALCRGDGAELNVRLSAFGADSASGELISSRPGPKARRPVILHCALLKKENFEWVAAKATEVGVSEIVPLITTRTVKTELRSDRVERIIREAAEQCGRCDLPALRQPQRLDSSLAGASKSNSFLFDMDGSPAPQLGPDFNEPVSIFVGPEGGWTPTELESAAARCSIAALGNLAFRAETAAVIAAHWACWS